MSSIPVEAGFGHDVTLVYPFSGCDSIDLIGKPIVESSNKYLASISLGDLDIDNSCYLFSIDHNGSVGDVTVSVSIARAEGKVRRLMVWSQVFSMMPVKGDNVVRIDISAARPTPVVDEKDKKNKSFIPLND